MKSKKNFNSLSKTRANNFNYFGAVGFPHGGFSTVRLFLSLAQIHREAGSAHFILRRVLAAFPPRKGKIQNHVWRNLEAPESRIWKNSSRLRAEHRARPSQRTIYLRLNLLWKCARRHPTREYYFFCSKCMKTFSNSFGLGLLLSFSIVEQRALSLFISCMCEYKAGRHDIKISVLPEPRCAILSDCIAFDARGQDFVSQSFPFLPRCQHQRGKFSERAAATTTTAQQRRRATLNFSTASAISRVAHRSSQN